MLLIGLMIQLYFRSSKIDAYSEPEAVLPCVDLLQIHERGRLDISLGYNSLNYYILHGKACGFQFELAKYFADYLGLELNIVVMNDMESAITALRTGEIDIVCSDLTKIEGRFGNEIVFTEPYAHVSQVLIQRKDNPKHQLVTDIQGLSGKTVYVPRGSVFKLIILNETDLISDPPVIIEVPGYGSEQLIDAVAEGKISYTVADHHLAKYHAFIYSNIDVHLEIGNEKPLSWCMRGCSPDLLKEFNIWLNDFSKTRQFGFLYHRYFINPWNTGKTNSDFFSVKKGKISPYDEIIKKHSKEIGWDWRLVASLIYEESKFQHDLVSYSGAYGIMQLIPVTAEYFGITPESTVEDHIRIGIRFIKMMDDNFKEYVPDSMERQKFVIASYNLGEGHIFDAIALADKYNRNPQIWDNNVEYLIIAKSQSKYFLDEVVQYGYCKGQITSGFVKSIMERYEHYKNAFSEQ